MLNKLKWIAGISAFIWLQISSYQRLVPDQTEAFLGANFCGLVGRLRCKLVGRLFQAFSEN